MIWDDFRGKDAPRLAESPQLTSFETTKHILSNVQLFLKGSQESFNKGCFIPARKYTINLKLLMYRY